MTARLTVPAVEPRTIRTRRVECARFSLGAARTLRELGQRHQARRFLIEAAMWRRLAVLTTVGADR